MVLAKDILFLTPFLSVPVDVTPFLCPRQPVRTVQVYTRNGSAHDTIMARANMYTLHAVIQIPRQLNFDPEFTNRSLEKKSNFDSLISRLST